MKKEKIKLVPLLLIIMGTLSFCSTIPKGVVAVKPFDKDKYIGKWYEIARFDFVFEKNLNNTTAEYFPGEKGHIKVVNSGFDYIKGMNKTATGKAKFAGDINTGMLKVSFFGPFYAGYNVIAIDEGYNYALVSGDSFKYLWILSRKPTIPDDVRKKYLAIADSLGFKTSGLIWVEHNR